MAIVEMELGQRRGDRARLTVIEPGQVRRWSGERSSRVLEVPPAELGCLIRCDQEVGRVGIEPIAGRIRLALGDHRLGIALAQRAIDQLEQADATAMLLAVLAAHARCSSWLVRTAAVSQHANRARRAPAVEPAAAVVPEVAVAVAVADGHAEPTPVLDFAEAQRDAIAHALASTHGKIYGQGGAALLLGLKPSTLQSKMRKLGLDRGQFV